MHMVNIISAYHLYCIVSLLAWYHSHCEYTLSEQLASL